MHFFIYPYSPSLRMHLENIMLDLSFMWVCMQFLTFYLSVMFTCLCSHCIVCLQSLPLFAIYDVVCSRRYWIRLPDSGNRVKTSLYFFSLHLSTSNMFLVKLMHGGLAHFDGLTLLQAGFGHTLILFASATAFVSLSHFENQVKSNMLFTCLIFHVPFECTS